jgi:2,3-diketo-5-methylthio-1-phosphopentane phosphatase
MSSCSSKILLVFDFDNTILSVDSDFEILSLLSQESIADLHAKYIKSNNLANLMQEVFIKMKEENKNVSQIKALIENIPFNPGYIELFDFIKNNKDNFETVIISGTNSLFLKWALEKKGITDLFPVCFTNWSEIDEEYVIKIKQHHHHSCKDCDESLCKKTVLNEFIINHKEVNNFSKIIYVGDGENDYCPATFLKEGDLLFSRLDFPLELKLFKNGFIQNIRSEVHVWKDGYEILQEIKKYCIKIKNIF